MSFTEMIRSIGKSPMQEHLQEVAVHADHKVLMEAANKSLLIVSDPWVILGEQLRPRLSCLLNTR
jgi:hypothetical protein